MLWIFGESIHFLGGTADAVGLGAMGLGAIPLGYYFIKGSPALLRGVSNRPSVVKLRAYNASQTALGPESPGKQPIPLD